MAEEEEPVPVHKIEVDDMDIDLAVAETLEDDKTNVAPMEVDAADEVEDELLSLVDDRPPPPPVVPAGRKVAVPTIPAAPFKPPASLKTDVDDIKLPSPTLAVSTSPAAVSPLVRPPSTHPGSDRESMPPPSAAPRGKDKEEEAATEKGDSVSAASSQPAKKKKEVGNKVSLVSFEIQRIV
jgi:COMPASS component SPP1